MREGLSLRFPKPDASHYTCKAFRNAKQARNLTKINLRITLLPLAFPEPDKYALQGLPHFIPASLGRIQHHHHYIYEETEAEKDQGTFPRSQSIK